jgi:hypothetical protein
MAVVPKLWLAAAAESGSSTSTTCSLLTLYRSLGWLRPYPLRRRISIDPSMMANMDIFLIHYIPILQSNLNTVNRFRLRLRRHHWKGLRDFLWLHWSYDYLWWTRQWPSMSTIMQPILLLQLKDRVTVWHMSMRLVPLYFHFVLVMCYFLVSYIHKLRIVVYLI